MDNSPPLLGFVAYSGTGKTTLLEKLIPILTDSNIRIGLIKHAHHNFDIDIPGKDSYRLRKAGAQQVLVASNARQAHIIENQNLEQEPNSEPDLAQCIASLQTDKLDLILVEGFKHVAYPKIEINRSTHIQPFMFQDDTNIIAVISDIELELPSKVSKLDLNNLEEITGFILTYLKNFNN